MIICDEAYNVTGVNFDFDLSTFDKEPKKL